MIETREQAAARAKEYRIRKKAEINVRDRKRWKEKRRYDRRAKTIGRRRCAFCEIRGSLQEMKVAWERRVKKNKGKTI